ncbi:hypothetical protein [Nocardia niwae]|uniref:Uncharacterized protein n=1 Tax=Nocardia niwae TaxID=626084 RepID=A0ABV2XDJ7_9NOCA|nr:hypothetical protein [Nocardia niwae]
MGVLQTIGRFAGSRGGLVLAMRTVSSEVSGARLPGIGEASGVRSGRAR